MARGVTSGRVIPLLPCSTTEPQNLEQIMGRCQAAASNCVRPNPSEWVGKRNTSASR